MYLMVYTFCNLLALLESEIRLPTSTREINVLQQGYRYHILRKTFSKFYRRHYELISKLNVGLKTLKITRGPFGTRILW